MTNKVCVIGAGSTRYGRLDESIIEIALDASKDAINSAGITPDDIQAGYISINLQQAIILIQRKWF